MYNKISRRCLQRSGFDSITLQKMKLFASVSEFHFSSSVIVSFAFCIEITPICKIREIFFKILCLYIGVKIQFSAASGNKILLYLRIYCCMLNFFDMVDVVQRGKGLDYFLVGFVFFKLLAGN